MKVFTSGWAVTTDLNYFEVPKPVEGGTSVGIDDNLYGLIIDKVDIDVLSTVFAANYGDYGSTSQDIHSICHTRSISIGLC